MTAHRILLTGVTGQLGSALAPMLEANATVLAPSRAELDLADTSSIAPFVEAARPDLIVNCAAYTAVDKAETEPALARLINTKAAEALARSAARIGTSIIQVSTDYVFDGQGDTPYLEEMETRPINIYGQTKLDGEHVVLAENPRATVVRVAWLYHTEGRNFLLTMLRLAETHPKLRVVNDQFGAPTYVMSLATALNDLCQQHLTNNAPYGVFHMPSGGCTSWHAFAQYIFELRQQHTGLLPPTVVGIPSSEYPTPAARPKYSLLSGHKTHSQLGLALPHWQDQLKSALASFYGETS